GTPRNRSRTGPAAPRRPWRSRRRRHSPWHGPLHWRPGRPPAPPGRCPRCCRRRTAGTWSLGDWVKRSPDPTHGALGLPAACAGVVPTYAAQARQTSAGGGLPGPPRSAQHGRMQEHAVKAGAPLRLGAADWGLIALQSMLWGSAYFFIEVAQPELPAL